MSTAIQVLEPSALQTAPKTANQIIAQRDQIIRAMKEAMVKDIDYGTIPGTGKPSLYKPGSEKLFSMFHLAVQPVVEDLSTPDCMRYRVFTKVTEMGTGRYLGEGVGEASSAESKYQWRAAVCPEEFNETPSDRRRLLWKKSQGGPYTVPQVRTAMEDVANTILKMAKKRSQIDAALTVTAASDVFMQDANELQEAGLIATEEHDVVQGDAGAGSNQQPSQSARPATLQPKQQDQPKQVNYNFQPAGAAPAQQQQRPAQAATGAGVGEARGRRFYAIAKGAGKENTEINEYLQSLGVKRSEEIPTTKYEAACDWAKGTF